MTYVVGLMFSKDFLQVALIRKAKPEWQRGKLNGIGGKVELHESPGFAMVREFQEETSSATTRESWRLFLSMAGSQNDGSEGKFSISFFASVGDLTNLQSPELEKVQIEWVKDVHSSRVDIVENLAWIIPLAIDTLKDGRPAITTCQYP